MKTLFIYLATLGVCVLRADLPYLPPKAEQLVGSWVGHDRDAVEIAGITLATNNTGCFAHSLPGQKPTIVMIRSWKIEKTNLTFEVSPTDARKAELAVIRATLTPTGLQLEIQLGKARRSYLLFKEEEFLTRLHELRDALREKKAPSR